MVNRDGSWSDSCVQLCLILWRSFCVHLRHWQSFSGLVIIFIVASLLAIWHRKAFDKIVLVEIARRYWASVDAFSGCDSFIGYPELVLLDRCDCRRFADGARFIVRRVERFLDHTNSFLLVAERGEATESQIICPVKAAILVRMLHAIRPILFALNVTSNFAPTVHILLLRFLRLLHELYIHPVQPDCLIFFLPLDFFQKSIDLSVLSWHTVIWLILLLCLLGVDRLVWADVEVGSAWRAVGVNRVVIDFIFLSIEHTNWFGGQFALAMDIFMAVASVSHSRLLRRA